MSFSSCKTQRTHTVMPVFNWVSFWPITIDAHNPVNQSQLKVDTWSWRKARDNVWTNRDGFYSWLDERVSRGSVMQNQLHSSKNCSIMKKGYFLKILPCSGDPRRDTARALLQLTQRKCAMLLEVSSPVTGCCISWMLKSRIRWGEP